MLPPGCQVLASAGRLSCSNLNKKLSLKHKRWHQKCNYCAQMGQLSRMRVFWGVFLKKGKKKDLSSVDKDHPKSLYCGVDVWQWQATPQHPRSQHAGDESEALLHFSSWTQWQHPAGRHREDTKEFTNCGSSTTIVVLLNGWHWLLCQKVLRLVFTWLDLTSSDQFR